MRGEPGIAALVDAAVKADGFAGDPSTEAIEARFDIFLGAGRGLAVTDAGAEGAARFFGLLGAAVAGAEGTACNLLWICARTDRGFVGDGSGAGAGNWDFGGEAAVRGGVGRRGDFSGRGGEVCSVDSLVGIPEATAFTAAVLPLGALGVALTVGGSAGSTFAAASEAIV